MTLKRLGTVFTFVSIMIFGLHAADLDTVNVFSFAMEKEITALAVLPDGYHSSDREYPSVYLLHGYGGGPFDWNDHTDLGSYADQHQIIIICPDGDTDSWYLDSPIDDGSQYATFVGRELVRWVDDNYRTVADQRKRAVTGLSMGGHGSLYLALKFPGKFAAAGSMSGALNLASLSGRYEINEKIGPYEKNQAAWNGNSIVSLVDQFKLSETEWYIDCGVDDIFIEDNRDLHNRLKAGGIEHRYFENTGRHSWDYWVSSLPDHLDYFSTLFDENEIVDESVFDDLDLTGLVAEAVADSAWPGAVLLVRQHGKTLVKTAAGYHTYERQKPVHADDIFDLASITKVISTTSAIMKLHDDGLISLDDKVTRHIPEFRGRSWWAGRQKAKIRIYNLLTHTSGLPPFKQYYRMDGGINARIDSVFNTPLEQNPNQETVYSDIGLITLGKLIERVSGKSLDNYVNEEIFTPLGMRSTGYNPDRKEFHRVVPTEYDPDGNLILGHVHDENAYSIGGVAGHAGLFSTAGDLAVFSQMMLDSGQFGDSQIFQPETVELFTHRANIIEGSSRCLGWDSPAGRASSGVYASDKSFGHTGFTGTSLWIDPENDIIVILLTNAVHPDRSWKSPKYFDWRQLVHSAVYLKLGFDTPNPNLILRDRWAN